MAQTDHLHLIKPGSEDTADIADINGNMDIIDDAVYALQQKIQYGGQNPPQNPVTGTIWLKPRS